MAQACPPDTERDRPNTHPHELVIITGMSGAGRSEAIHTFEDLGYFCIDNLPPGFIGQLVDLTELPGSRIKRLAVVCDVRGAEFFNELAEILDALLANETPHHVLFLEASDEVLVRRFKETRRRHPLCTESGSIAEGIAAERVLLADVRARADGVIDTSDLKPAGLRAAIKQRYFSESLAPSLTVTVLSFGFKYGLPIDADLVMDVRFLPNPYYVPELRTLTGLEVPVRTYVLDRPETTEFLDRWFELLRFLAPGYLMEGKAHLEIALGCTGGQHRSVALSEETAVFLRQLGYTVAVTHRDMHRDRDAR
ncbi:MAG: RNase adapter RapZ [Coriobacteriia bacterium]